MGSEHACTQQASTLLPGRWPSLHGSPLPWSLLASYLFSPFSPSPLFDPLSLFYYHLPSPISPFSLFDPLSLFYRQLPSPLPPVPLFDPLPFLSPLTFSPSSLSLCLPAFLSHFSIPFLSPCPLAFRLPWSFPTSSPHVPFLFISSAPLRLPYPCLASLPLPSILASALVHFLIPFLPSRYIFSLSIPSPTFPLPFLSLPPPPCLPYPPCCPSSPLILSFPFPFPLRTAFACSFRRRW